VEVNLSVRKRLFLILFFAGLVGILSLLLVDIPAVIALVPFPPGSEVPVITPTLKILSLVQPAVILVGALLIGIFLAPKVGLSSPVAEALAAGREVVPALRPQVVPGLVGGLIGGSLILLSAAIFKPFLSTATLVLIGKFARIMPILTRVLYGGIIEELLLRWGLMTFLVWVVWRLFQKRQARPTSTSVIAAILISSFIFGVGHLPVALGLVQETTAALIMFVIVANSAFGVVAGYLYWKYGLESAIIAHMCCHVVLAIATYAGAYF